MRTEDPVSAMKVEIERKLFLEREEEKVESQGWQKTRGRNRQRASEKTLDRSRERKRAVNGKEIPKVFTIE